MTEYRYKLEAYKGIGSRFECPRCKEKRVFTRYIDAHTGNHLDYDVGRCAREVNCGFHYTPRQFFFDNKDSKLKPHISKTPTKIQNATPISYIESDLLEKSLKAEKSNYFIDFLFLQFGKIIANQLIAKYKIGTSKHWDGATVFWQIDCDDKIRTGKIMKYNSNTGKRVKEPHPHITWVHKVQKPMKLTTSDRFKLTT